MDARPVARIGCCCNKGFGGFRGHGQPRMGHTQSWEHPGTGTGEGRRARERRGANVPGSPQILAALPMDWRGTHLLACSCLRMVFIPLFILCVYPSGAPALRHPAWPCVFSLLMGISNGYFGSVPMILAAGKVSPKQRELAGKAWHPAARQGNRGRVANRRDCSRVKSTSGSS